MSQEDESSKLFDTVDTLADQHLQELHRSVEQARDTIDGSARSIAAQLRGEVVPSAPSSSAAAKTPPASPNPSPPDLQSIPTSGSVRVPQKSPGEEASDFGDIAATIATDDDWKKR